MLSFLRLASFATLALSAVLAAPTEAVKRQVLNPGIHAPAPGSTLTAGKAFLFGFADNNSPAGRISNVVVSLRGPSGTTQQLGNVPFPHDSNEATANLTVPANDAAGSYTLLADEYFSDGKTVQHFNEPVTVQHGY